MAAHITPGPRHRFVKRQRDEGDDEARTTVERVTRGRSTPPAETSTEAEETTSSSRRRNTSTTTSETPTTTSETTSRTPTRTTSSTTSERTSRTTSTTSSSSPTTSSTTATSSSEPSSSSERSTSSIDTTSSRSSASSSAESAVSSDDVGKNSNGPIIGAIIAVVAVVAICLAGFLWWKRRKSQQKINEAGYLPENGAYPDDDDRSFVGGSKNDSMVAATKFDEKAYEPGAFNLQDMPQQNAAAFGGPMSRGAPGGDPRYLSSNNAGFGAPLTYGTYPDPNGYSGAPATPASAHMPHPGYAYGAQQASHDAEQQLYEPEPSPPSPYSPDGYGYGQAGHQQPMSRDMASPFADPQQPYHTAENFTVPPVPQKKEQPEMAYEAAGMHSEQHQDQGGDDSREEGPFADPQYVNKLFKVVRTFQPSMSDELKVTFGDRIKILVAYDDGWCLGENLDSASNGSTNIRGVFPRDCVQEVKFNDNNEEQELRALTPIQDASRPTSPVTPMRDSELYESEPPTAAPTLPPLDIGDCDSQTFDEAAYSSMPSTSASNLHPAYPASHPQTPVIEVSHSGMYDDDNRDAHLSASSSMQDSSVIDHFPQTPTAAMTPGLEESPVQPRNHLDDPNRASQAAKRTSSLLASRDADLFMALGQALDERDLR